jgi:putative FmdB family regulatory protein
MPFYEYKCNHCGEITEELESIETMSIPCPKCKKDTVRLLSVPTLHFKGNDWCDKKIRAEKEQRKKNDQH